MMHRDSLPDDAGCRLRGIVKAKARRRTGFVVLLARDRRVILRGIQPAAAPAEMRIAPRAGPKKPVLAE